MLSSSFFVLICRLYTFFVPPSLLQLGAGGILGGHHQAASACLYNCWGSGLLWALGFWSSASYPLLTNLTSFSASLSCDSIPCHFPGSVSSFCIFFSVGDVLSPWCWKKQFSLRFLWRVIPHLCLRGIFTQNLPLSPPALWSSLPDQQKEKPREDLASFLSLTPIRKVESSSEGNLRSMPFFSFHCALLSLRFSSQRINVYLPATPPLQ